MNIVIVGAGTVGTSICTQLIKENHDITVVDERQSVLSELTDEFDVASVCGNGADISVLRLTTLSFSIFLLSLLKTSPALSLPSFPAISTQAREQRLIL